MYKNAQLPTIVAYPALQWPVSQPGIPFGGWVLFWLTGFGTQLFSSVIEELTEVLQWEYIYIIIIVFFPHPFGPLG
jgi:hypothetical protein